MSTQPLSFHPIVSQDSSSALYRHWLSMDEVPVLFSKNPAYTNDSAQIRQVDITDYSTNGRFFSNTKTDKPFTVRQPGEASDFLFISLLVFPILVALFIAKSSFSRIQGAYKALFNNRFASIFIRNFTIGNQFTTYIIVFNTVASLSLGAWLWLVQEQQISGIGRYEALLMVFLLLSGYFIYRNMVIFLSRIIFETHESTEQFLYRDYFVNTVAATTLPFVNFAAAFSPALAIWWYLAAGIISLLLIYRIILFVYIGILERTYGAFYFILYFCTVEILPVAFLLKILTERISAYNN